jgi:hypothetical protein
MLGAVIVHVSVLVACPAPEPASMGGGVPLFSPHDTSDDQRKQGVERGAAWLLVRRAGVVRWDSESLERRGSTATMDKWTIQTRQRDTNLIQL